MLLSKEASRSEWQYLNVPALFEFSLYESVCRLTDVYFYSVKMRQRN